MDVSERLVGPHWQAIEVLLYREIRVTHQTTYLRVTMEHNTPTAAMGVRESRSLR